MAFVHEQSCECTKSELDLFSVPPTQTSMKQGSWVELEYHPLTTVTERSPIEFDISGTGEDYIDFAYTILYAKAKLTANDGANVAADAAIGPVNLFLHVDISLNGTLITASMARSIPIWARAMLKTLLTYGEDANDGANVPADDVVILQISGQSDELCGFCR